MQKRGGGDALRITVMTVFVKSLITKKYCNKMFRKCYSLRVKSIDCLK